MAKILFTNENLRDQRLDPEAKTLQFGCEGTKNLSVRYRWRRNAAKYDTIKNHNLENHYLIDFLFRYTKDNGKRTAISIGNYPDTSPDQAITTAKNYNARIKAGESLDQYLGDRSEKEVLKSMMQTTAPMEYRIGVVLTLFEQDKKKLRISDQTMKDYCADLRNNAVEFLGKDIRKLRAKEWDDHIYELANVKGKKGAAMNIHKAMRRLLNYAVEEEIIPANPLNQRKKVLDSIRQRPKTNYLDGFAVQKFINEIDKQKIPDDSKLMLKMILYLGIRPEEVIRIKLGWIDVQRGRIEHPEGSVKDVARVGKTVTTHMPEPFFHEVMDWVKTLKEKIGSAEKEMYLFPKSVDGEIESHTIHASTYNADQTKKLQKWIPLLTPATLRKTVATHLEAHGKSELETELVLNHEVRTGAAKNYKHSELLNIKMRVVEEWWTLLEKAKTDVSVLLYDSERIIETADKYEGLIS